jgi:hypothetical protein
MNLRALHLATAWFIALFALIHIANHLTALASVSTHMRVMDIARFGYRQPVVEAALLLGATFQSLSGLWFVAARWKQRRGYIAWLQAASGSYLALFLVVHVSAVMYGRWALRLDTNFYFAAAGFHVPPFQYFFVPYYFLAVVAVFTHVACVGYWRVQARAPWRGLVVALPILVGTVVSSLIILSLAGKILPFEVPAKYNNTYLRARATDDVDSVEPPTASLVCRQCSPIAQ